MHPDLTIDASRTAAAALRLGDDRECVRAIQTAQDALDSAKSACLAGMVVSKVYELDGASTLNAWVSNQLRMNTSEAAVLVRAAATVEQLPLVGESACAGLIRTAHVQVFTYGIKHIGLDIMTDAQPWLLHVAHANEPAELFRVVRGLREAYFPEDLDKAWLKGMDKEDIRVEPTTGGYHVTGFLNPVTGAKFQKVLDSVSAPRDKDDDRPGAERRVQGFDDLLSSILGNGLPFDKGIRPHLSVFVDADTVAAAAEHVKQTTERPWRKPDPVPPTQAATLAGHGSIGPNLLMYFLCVSDLSAFLIKQGDAQSQVLNAGRVTYPPTLMQRRAVIARQKGVCATPGCRHTHLEVHHTIWWSLGGPTDLDLLVGICVRCHHLVHRGLLHITGTAVNGYTFTNREGHPLRHRRRTGYHRAA